MEDRAKAGDESCRERKGGLVSGQGRVQRSYVTCWRLFSCTGRDPCQLPLI